MKEARGTWKRIFFSCFFSPSGAGRCRSPAPTQAARCLRALPPAPAARLGCCQSPASPCLPLPALPAPASPASLCQAALGAAGALPALPGCRRSREAGWIPSPAAARRGKPDLYSSLMHSCPRRRQGEKLMEKNQKQTNKKTTPPQLSFIPPRWVPSPGFSPPRPARPGCRERTALRDGKGAAHAPSAALGTGCVPAHLSWTPPPPGTACVHAGSCRPCKEKGKLNVILMSWLNTNPVKSRMVYF